MKKLYVFVVFGIGVIIGLAGGVLAGDMSDMPFKTKVGISLSMIGAAVLGYVIGTPIDETKDDKIELSS